MNTPTTDDAWMQQNGESAYAHESRKRRTMRNMEDALRSIISVAPGSGPLWHGSAEIEAARRALDSQNS
jgi:hypothetical protein